ncbi:MAG: efflux RND transporter permease subunit [Gammaproteobacteria bacterium]|nr:efflux RND transporter permease subunit [Gammaproteobacteria bacterium]
MINRITHWSIHHPIGISMMVLALLIIGLYAFQRLPVNLLPNIIYPEIRVRILDPGVPATIMEERITRQLEEQLAITEDANNVYSQTSEGRSAVSLSFPYGTDINQALRDASTRLDRAKRFLPDSIEPPVIYKYDPSQLPVAEFVISSDLKDPIELRHWVEQIFSKWFINLPGVAAAEVGGGLLREIQILPDPQRLQALGLSIKVIEEALSSNINRQPTGRVSSPEREFSSQTYIPITRLDDLRHLQIKLPNNDYIALSEIAQIRDTHQDERIRVRFNQNTGIKLSIQKQPSANTVAVVDAVKQRITWLQQNQQLPDNITLQRVTDQSIYIRYSLSNASMAAIIGSLLAMAIVFLFLGDIKRTLIIGSAIPISIIITFLFMNAASFSMNIMTLGGLAVGIGILMDSTIIMLENISRHQAQGGDRQLATQQAAMEINHAIVASTATNLAAIIPFLFISGLIGLLFSGLIFTITFAIIISMIMALTLVPALAARIHLSQRESLIQKWVRSGMQQLTSRYEKSLRYLLTHASAWRVFLTTLILALAASLYFVASAPNLFIPGTDDGRIYVGVTADAGISLDTMDAEIKRLETLLLQEPDVADVFTIVGGYIFGRSQSEFSNRSSLYIQLVPVKQRPISKSAWVAQMRDKLAKNTSAGFKVRMRATGVRGLRMGHGEDDITLRIQGNELGILNQLGKKLTKQLEQVKGLANVTYSGEAVRQELNILTDHKRATELGINTKDIAAALQIALEGKVIAAYIEDDEQYDIRIRLPIPQNEQLSRLHDTLIFSPISQQMVQLNEVATIRLQAAPEKILRNKQRRMIEITASLNDKVSPEQAHIEIDKLINKLNLPDGYSLYDAGSLTALEAGKNTSALLLLLAIFLVFVVLSIQYESLRAPLIILFTIPFTLIGVSGGLFISDTAVSMPVWLGMIMLTGIVVNNAIVLVEYIKTRQQQEDSPLITIITSAAAIRLRPILMTTLTTVIGLTPLAIGFGEGSEMMQPLAITMVFGLSSSMIITLFLLPLLYLKISKSK